MSKRKGKVEDFLDALEYTDTNMSDDLPTLEQRWSIASLELEKHGMDVSKIVPLRQAAMLHDLENEDVIGADDDVWRDWVDAELEAHPAWALPRWFRLKHSRDLIDNWHQGWDGPGPPEYDELAQNKYALLSWHRGNSIVSMGGDTIEAMLEKVCMIQYSDEDPEYVESFIDLDTGEWHRLTNPKADEPQLKTTITLAYGDHTYTHRF